MMAQYCFAEQKRALFTEAYLRGILAALLDFPRLKTHWECIVAPQSIPGDLRGQVCCIRDDDAYGELIVSAWCWGYLEIEQYSERNQFVWAEALRRVPLAEALALARRSMTSAASVASIDAAYAQFLTLPPGQVMSMSMIAERTLPHE